MDRTWCLMAVGDLRGPNSTGAGRDCTEGLRGGEFGISMVKGRGGEAINIGVTMVEFGCSDCFCSTFIIYFVLFKI